MAGYGPELGTLDEPVSHTIMRDVTMVGNKMMCVLNPRKANIQTLKDRFYEGWVAMHKLGLKEKLKKDLSKDAANGKLQVRHDGQLYKTIWDLIKRPAFKGYVEVLTANGNFTTAVYVDPWRIMWLNPS